MTETGDDAMDESMRQRVRSAQQAADRAVLPELPGTLTPEIDPPIHFAGGFRDIHAVPSVAGTSITRHDLLDLGRALSADSSAHQLAEFLVAVNAWGYGASGLGIYRTRQLLRDETTFVRSARRTLAILHSNGPDSAAGAYYNLNNTSQGRVRGWGPSFFTKFISFADPANQPGAAAGRDPAMVLDRWLAKGMSQLIDEQPHEHPALPSFRRWGWTTPQYAFYVRIVRRLAEQPRFERPPYDGRCLAVERVLFQYYRDGDGKALARQA